jgi:hypothetical protein
MRIVLDTNNGHFQVLKSVGFPRLNILTIQEFLGLL